MGLLFGNLFDFNGDGKTDILEEVIAMDMIGFFDKKPHEDMEMGEADVEEEFENPMRFDDENSGDFLWSNEDADDDEDEDYRGLL